ncbi:MAG: FecR domain-containing protein [Bacteroidales bacterium]|nr:FecR domain-containing protein [Bacteroidales bacterium]MDD3990113.1 FecR domain-containing protein [Bacteroidales bacterium]
MKEINKSVTDNLLSRILNGKATAEEIKLFSEWINDYDNELYFERFKQMWHVSVDSVYRKTHSNELSPARFVRYIRESRRKAVARRTSYAMFSAAASILLAFGIYTLLTLEIEKQKPDLTALKYSKDSVRVELENGNVVHKVVDSVANITNIENVLEEKSAELSMKSAGSREKDIKLYNTVTTPPGERVVMALPDGSKVYLTSNSYLRYPAQFDRDKREVTLSGRAYFEVKKSTTPFIVSTSDMNIEVLGTSFDVESRYTRDNSSVILVEGSVKVLADGKTRVIYPDEQISLHRITREMTVRNVDSRLLTMWKDGVLIVQGQSFTELIESVSSWYGIEIIDLTTVSPREKFNGRFDREDIDVAIEAISISAKIKYRVHEGKLVLEDHQ